MMKKTMQYLSFALSLSLSACISAEKDEDGGRLDLAGAEVELDGLKDQTIQLQTVYSACKSLGIKNKEDVEELINSGGNGMTRLCKEAVRNLDISKLSLSVELPEITKPGDPFTPIEKEFKLIKVPNNVNRTPLVVKIPEGLAEADLELWGQKANAQATLLNTSLIEKFPIGFTVDYSASMLEEDILYSVAWINKLQALDENLGVSLVDFSSDLEKRTNREGLGPILVNENLERDMTSLFDAWGTNLNYLATLDQFALHIVITDGAENHSREWTEETLAKKIKDVNVFNMVFASGFVSKSNLNTLTAEKGIWFYSYYLIEADELIDQAESYLKHLKVVDVNDLNLEDYDKVFATYGADTLVIQEGE